MPDGKPGSITIPVGSAVDRYPAPLAGEISIRYGAPPPGGQPYGRGIAITRYAGTEHDDQPVIETLVLDSHQGGQPGKVHPTNLFTGILKGSPADNTWNTQSAFTSEALLPSSAELKVNPFAGQHGNLHLATVRQYPGAIPQGRQLAPLWGLWNIVIDRVDAPSSASGHLFGIEQNILTNGPDDGRRRWGMIMTFGQADRHGSRADWNMGLDLTGDGSDVMLRDIIHTATPYSVAALDLRDARQEPGAHGIWLSDNQDIAFRKDGAASLGWSAPRNSVQVTGAGLIVDKSMVAGGLEVGGSGNKTLVRFTDLPTSPAGLPSGTLWRDAGQGNALKVVP